MDIVKNVKEISSDLEHGIKEGVKKTKSKLASVASHLPFINMAKNKENQYTIEVDLPGVEKKDIDLTIDGNTLTVCAERQFKKEVKKEDYYHLSSYFGKISRSFTLPEVIDKDKVDAEYKDGRLYIHLNESEKKKQQQVSIK
jgi:HSP20 family protein